MAFPVHSERKVGHVSCSCIDSDSDLDRQFCRLSRHRVFDPPSAHLCRDLIYSAFCPRQKKHIKRALNTLLLQMGRHHSQSQKKAPEISSAFKTNLTAEPMRYFPARSTSSASTPSSFSSIRKR